MCSVLLPFVCLTLAAAQWHYRRRSGRETRGSIVCHFGGPEALTIFGGTLIVLFASGKDSRGSSRRRPRIVVVRQQYTFSPPDTVREIEDYTLHLEAVTILELHPCRSCGFDQQRHQSCWLVTH